KSSLARSTASSSQGCPGPRTAPTNARTTRARSTSPATFTLSRTVAPVISAPPSRPPGKTRRGRTDAREIHAHLSRHRQAEYAPTTGCPQESGQVHLPVPRTATKTVPAGQEAESPGGKLTGRHISYHPRLSCLCGCVFPGQPDGVDFLVCRLAGARCLKSCGDEDAAEQGGHVAGGRFGLAGVPGRVQPAFPQAGGVAAGGGVPGDGDGLAGDLERDGGLDGAGGAVAGLPGAEKL